MKLAQVFFPENGGRDSDGSFSMCCAYLSGNVLYP